MVRRNITIDNIRGLGIIAVVLGHVWIAPEFLRKVMYAFHMPLFFILSGYLFNEFSKLAQPFGSFLKNRVLRLYIPGIVIGLSCAIPSYFAGHTDSLRKFAIQVGGLLYSVPEWNYTFNATPIWFLACLLCVEVYYWLICKYVKWNRWLSVLLAFSVGLIVLRLTQWPFPLNCQIALTGLIFYHIGVELRRIRFVDAHEGKWPLFLASSVVLISVTYLNPIKVGFAAGRLGDLNLLFLGSLSGAYALFYVASKITVHTPISFLGKNTILILGYNYWMYDLVSRLGSRFGASQWYVNLAGQLLLFCIIALILSRVPWINYLLQGASPALTDKSRSIADDSSKTVNPSIPPHV